MRIVVVGATGNLGTRLVEALVADPAVEEIVGLARRRPDPPYAHGGKVRHVAADVSRDHLAPHLRGADAVVHLAWAIQPSHGPELLRRTNLLGSRRLLDAVAEARVPAFVFASSVGAYSPGPKDRLVPETWPTGGISTSFYSRHKVAVERMLDAFEESTGTRVVRVRPSITYDRHSAAHVGRLYIGRQLPKRLLRIVPDIPGLRIQVTHAADTGRAFALVTTTDARGPYNVAADRVLDPDVLAAAFPGGVRVRMRPAVARAVFDLTWRLRVQPTPVGWIDMALRTPLMDASRIRALGWTPAYSSLEATRELVDGLREGDGAPSPPLAPHVSPVEDPNVRVG